MTFLSQPEYIDNQYKDNANLEARIALHLRFSSNSQGWMPWIFEQLDLQPKSRVLELGCGPGSLWVENRKRIPGGLRLHLSDLSAGMLSTTRRALQNLSPLPAFAQIDAVRLPFCADSFDAVLANHMLYHVSNRNETLAEIRRVLRSGGRLCATTVGENHMREVDELARRFDPTLDEFDNRLIEFSLENGAEQLAPWFDHIQLRHYPDGLVVTEASPLAAYITSGTLAAVPADKRAKLHAWLEAELERSGGAIQITKDSGIFICD